MSATIKILIVEPAELVRKGIIACLKVYFHTADFFESESYDKATKILEVHNIDLILSELELGDSNGFSLLRQKNKAPVKIILLTYQVKKEYIITAKHLGASGFFSKNIAPELLAENMRRALTTNLFTSNEWFSVDHKENTAFILRTIELLENLSKQEKKALRLFCQNYNTQEVSEAMHVQRKSVDNYKNRIAKKMELPPELYFRDWIRNHGTFLGYMLKIKEIEMIN